MNLDLGKNKSTLWISIFILTQWCLIKRWTDVKTWRGCVQDADWGLHKSFQRKPIRAVAILTVPGGQEFHFPHFFLKFRSIFLIFAQTYLFSSSFWPSAHPGRPWLRYWNKLTFSTWVSIADDKPKCFMIIKIDIKNRKVAIVIFEISMERLWLY